MYKISLRCVKCGTQLEFRTIKGVYKCYCCGQEYEKYFVDFSTGEYTFRIKEK